MSDVSKGGIILDIEVSIRPKYLHPPIDLEDQARRMEAEAFCRTLTDHYRARLEADLLDKLEYLISQGQL